MVDGGEFLGSGKAPQQCSPDGQRHELPLAQSQRNSGMVREDQVKPEESSLTCGTCGNKKCYNAERLTEGDYGFLVITDLWCPTCEANGQEKTK